MRSNVTVRSPDCLTVTQSCVQTLCDFDGDGTAVLGRGQVFRQNSSRKARARGKSGLYLRSSPLKVCHEYRLEN